VAAGFTGIYPFASPGGWDLIGRAVEAGVFDPARDPAALFAPGDRVRFVPVRGDSVEAAPAAKAEPPAKPVETCDLACQMQRAVQKK
jgi:allophanate hydrolase subunit 1